jgi:hypothetical protein
MMEEREESGPHLVDHEPWAQLLLGLTLPINTWRRCTMFWMLLPLDENAERHLDAEQASLRGYWADVVRTGLDAIRHLLHGR